MNPDTNSERVIQKDGLKHIHSELKDSLIPIFLSRDVGGFTLKRLQANVCFETSPWYTISINKSNEYTSNLMIECLLLIDESF